MNYLDMINDPVILNHFRKIDDHNDNRFDHGKQHTLNVIDNALNLTKILNINEPDIKYICIACLLHDVGQLEGSKDHYIRSKDFTKTYLNDKVSEPWLSKILSAIEKHHEKADIDNLSLFEHIVLFADKMDFSHKRLDINYVNKHDEDCVEKHIKDINFKIENNIFKVVILTDGIVNNTDFYNWGYFMKIQKRIEEFSRKIKMDYEIIIKASY